MNDINQVVKNLAAALMKKSWHLATAESCTGGWIAKCCTDLAGSSAWFDRAYVTYCNEAKVEMLGVDQLAVEQYGAVSEQVVRQMADGARRSARVEITVAVTGVAGPDGGSENKPVGTVWFGWSMVGQNSYCELMHFAGDRDAVRRQTVLHALQGLLLRLTQ